MTKVSVIMPVYNVEDYLEDSLFLLLNQTLKDIEIICVNDGSTDNSLNILKNFAKKDSRIKILDQKNYGASIARNNGMEIAQGEYIYFFDADDLIAINILEKLYNNAISNKSDFVVFKIVNFNDKSIEYDNYIYDLDGIFKDVDFNNFTFTHLDIKENVLNTAFAPWTKFYDKKFLEKNKLKFPDIPSYNDVLFHVKSILKASKISFVPEFLYYYRLDNTNSITNDSSKHINIFNVIDSVEDFLIEEDFIKDYEKEFDLFKINQISRHMATPVSEEYFKLAKKEFLKIDLSNNNLIMNQDLEKYYVTLNLSIEELDKFEDYLNLANLKKKNYNLKKSIKQLNKTLNKQKNIHEDISKSHSWKLTKPLRNFTKFTSGNKISIKEHLLNKSNSYNHFKSEYKRLSKKNKDLINKNNKLSGSNKKLKKQNNELEKINDKLISQYNSLDKKIDDFQLYYKESTENNEKTLDFFNNRINVINHDLVERDNFNKSLYKELQYAFVFEDTIKESEWLNKKDFSLINSAANYSFAYSLYRILNDAKPKNILELGLGQTTKLTTQYVNHFTGSKLTVVEGDKEWIDKFSENLVINENTQILNLDLENFTYCDDETIRFKDFPEVVGNQKFDLIIIDGPQGFIIDSENNSVELNYSRTNIWQLIPQNLADEFIIIFDDFNRTGEKNTVSYVKELLNKNSINFYEYNSWAFKTQHAIFSENYKYIGWI